MPLTPQELTTLQADDDVRYVLEPLRIVKANQVNLVQALWRAGLTSQQIAKLAVRFDLTVESNPRSRPTDYPAPDGPVRGILSAANYSDAESTTTAATQNADADVVKALQLCELTVSEIIMAHNAIFSAAAKQGLDETKVSTYGLMFDLNFVVGLGVKNGCAHPSCPGVRIC